MILASFFNERQGDEGDAFLWGVIYKIIIPSLYRLCFVFFIFSNQFKNRVQHKLTFLTRLSYSEFCSAKGMRHILFWDAQFCPKNIAIFLNVFAVFFVFFFINVEQKDFHFMWPSFKEIIARNVSNYTNLTILNILCASLASFPLFKKLLICFFCE